MQSFNVGEDGASRKSWRVLIESDWFGRKRRLWRFMFTETQSYFLGLKRTD
jgi:hypothetical protein